MTETTHTSDIPVLAQTGAHFNPVQDDIAAAEGHKNTANEAFKEKNYLLAIELYGKAIDCNPMSAVYHANRAFAHIRMETYGSAVEDGTQAIALDPKYVKGYYRRGDACYALGKYKDSLKDFKSAAKLAPRDPDLRKKLTACEKEVKRIRFEEALATPDVAQTPVADTIDMASMSVEDSYDGPHLEGNIEEGYTVTPGFTQDMLHRFKDQKLIHRRYAFAIILQAYEILKGLPSLVDVPVPRGTKLTVCGDVHGQYFDLLNIFDINGLPSKENPYLFNGDFVDRGSWSAEIILTLFAYKVMYPQHVHLARGNHESRGMNKIYGFDGEISHKFSSQMIELFRDTFCWLPLLQPCPLSRFPLVFLLCWDIGKQLLLCYSVGSIQHNMAVKAAPPVTVLSTRLIIAVFVQTASSSALFPNSQQLEQPGTKAISSDQGFTLDKSAQAAASLASAWGLGSSYAFAEIAGPTVSLSDALSTLGMFSAVLVVLPGSRPPERPTNDTAKPFLTLQEGQYEGQLSNVLPISSINKAAASASAVLGQPLYPFRLEVLQFTKSSDHGPWVLYHVPTGSICLDKRVLENMKELPVTMASHMADFANQLFGHISGINVAAVQEASTGSYLGGIFSGAAAAASLAVASQIPLWFCITCPIVLGMLFPFAFNFGLGAIADELCTYYNLPADACTQLWYSAFALAMILSFASVLPIVTICRLAQCARNVSPRPG